MSCYILKRGLHSRTYCFSCLSAYPPIVNEMINLRKNSHVSLCTVVKNCSGKAVPLLLSVTFILIQASFFHFFSFFFKGFYIYKNMEYSKHFISECIQVPGLNGCCAFKLKCTFLKLLTDDLWEKRFKA